MTPDSSFMHILMVSNLYPPHARGGAEQIARRTALELHLRGHEVTVFSTMPYQGIRSWFTQMTERNPETVYRICPPNLYYLLDDFQHPFPVRALWHLVDLWSPFPAHEVRRLIGQLRPDVVVTHNLKGLGLQVARGIRESGVPHVHVLHDVQLSVPSGLLIYGKENDWMNRTCLRRWYELRIQAAIGSPAVIISPSKFLTEFHRTRGFFPQSRFELLQNPAPRFRVFERSGVHQPALRLLYAGQLEEHKGIRFLYGALRVSDIPFSLHIAGEGMLAEEIAQWAKSDPRVVQHGFVSLDNLSRLLATADVTVVPSICYEGSPTIIYESLQAGVPVIASAIGGVSELIQDGKNGYLFSPGNQEEFLKSLKCLVDRRDPVLFDPAAIRQTAEPYSMEKYIQRFETMLKGLIGQG